MIVIEIIFWISLFIIFYTFIGYGLLVTFLVSLKRLFIKEKKNTLREYPEVTLFVTAFNEIDTVEQKVQNSFDIDYPKDKIQYLWMTDGSDDGTPEALSEYDNIIVKHLPERKGKIAAMNRGLKFIESPIIIFSDANTLLNKDSVKIIAEAFADKKVGCISGEKRIVINDNSGASSVGEGFYWKYESFLKQKDSELYSAVGAAGELFAVRKELMKPVEEDTLLDDFIISLRIAMKGYKIKYTPNAYAMEYASENVKEELKRKVRMAAGGFQTILRIKELLNPFKYGILTFQYVSHKVLRWTLAPLMLLLIIPINILLAIFIKNIYLYLLFFQIIFYVFALFGWYFEKRKIKLKILYIPYYFYIMNYSIFLGFIRYLTGRQNVKWDKAKRAGN